jgi:hypothetical protein
MMMLRKWRKERRRQGLLQRQKGSGDEGNPRTEVNFPWAGGTILHNWPAFVKFSPIMEVVPLR